MKTLRVSCLIGAVLLFGAVFAREISLDYDHAVDFSAYRTYLWTQGTPAANPNVDRAIVEAVDAQLKGKGFTKVEKEADFCVLYRAVLREEATSTDYDYGKFKLENRNVVVQRYTVGTLVVDVVDAKSKNLLWRATATDAVGSDPTKTQEEVPGLVGLMFKGFPPEKAP